MKKAYRKPQELQYKTRERTRRRGLRLHRKMTGQVFSRKAGSGRASAVANVMDVTYFLTKYLSGKDNVMVTPSRYVKSFGVGKTKVAGKDFYQVFVPHWDEYDLPVRGFDKYRIYREGVWHESSHIRYTPEPVYKHGNLIEHDVINIIEDKRIEDLGVEEWRGYIPERLYTQAYAYALRPDVSKLYDKNYTPDSTINQNARFEAFLQRLLIGKVKGGDKLPPSEMEKVEKTAQKVEEKLEKLKKDKDNHAQVYLTLANLTRDVINDLGIHQVSPQHASPRAGSSWDDTFSEEYAKSSKVKGEDVKEEIKKFFKEIKKKCKRKKREDDAKIPPGEVTEEDVEKAKSGTEEVQTEFEKIKKQQPIDPILVRWQPIATQVPPEKFRDQKFITMMDTRLRHWKVGYREKVGEKGARLSIPDYIRHKEEPFATRIKQSARGRKILVLADFSGSMSDREVEYKRALISSMEVLDGIGCKTALFGFGGDPAVGNTFFYVKRFEEPKWKSNHSAKLAAVEASYSCTPTAEAYCHLENYIKRHRPHVTVTVTDGSPDSPTVTKHKVQDLKKHTRMVAFGIGPPLMEKQLRGFGYHKSFAVEDIHQIPLRLVRMIAPD